MMKFASPKLLKQLGVVGMNYRNVVMIAQNNQRKYYPLVDDKLKTKIICKEADIAVPDLLGVCTAQFHVKQLAEFLKDDQGFVIKPAKGSGGKGILVITGRSGEDFVKPSGQVLKINAVQKHVSNILSGLYSLGGKPDVAMIEALVNFTDAFEGYSYEGVPDVRVIVYKGYPILAMMRLSTKSSDGKANLHQGAIGVGINLQDGSARFAVQHAKPIQNHPDTDKLLTDLQVPRWHELMLLAAKSSEGSKLGYLGVDLVLDRDRGPLVLELNARPGLAIQMANGQGLMPKVHWVDGRLKHHPDEDFEQRVDAVYQSLLSCDGE